MVLTFSQQSLPDPMQLAIEAAQNAADRGEVPVGAVLVEAETGKILSTTHNYVEDWRDCTAHAEILALQDACQQRGNKRLVDCDLYVTLEPCAMCAGALVHARIRRLVFGAYDPKSGGVVHGAEVFSHPQAHHKPEVQGGVREEECASLLKSFFADLRANKAKVKS